MGCVRCSRCGKRVSNEVNGDIVVRAFVECPECAKVNEVAMIANEIILGSMAIEKLLSDVSQCKTVQDASNTLRKFIDDRCLPPIIYMGPLSSLATRKAKNENAT
jgi:phage FluMu protein Com